ncbi:MAG: uroporphyrinogen decarboxylase family protein [Saccharofermentanales bacterium]
MNSKERVLRTIKRQETDRIPMDLFGTTGEMLERIKTQMGLDSVDDVYRNLGIDLWCNWNMGDYVGVRREYMGLEADFWGVPISSQSLGDSSNLAPLMNATSVDEIERYQWPDPNDFNLNNVIESIDEHKEFAVIGGVWAPIFHNITWLCGFETALMNIQTEPEITEALIRHVTDFWVGYTRNLLEAGQGKIDLIQNCNDFGAQSSMIMSPDIFRKHFKPALKRLYNCVKSFDVKVFQHSCGSIYPIIPDLIEIGVDVLNPVQVSAAGMDPASIKKEFGDKLTFDGGIDTQHVLPEGTPDEVQSEVRRIVRILGENGGYILAPSQGLESDVPIDNVVAMYDEAKISKQR